MSEGANRFLSTSNSSESGKEHTVLIIDNNINIAELLEIHLKDLSCKVTKAFNGITGLELARNEKFDLIVLSDRLPGIHGLDVCQMLKTANDFTPVLMLSSIPKRYRIDNYQQYGVDFFLMKPFGISTFKDQILKIFSD